MDRPAYADELKSNRTRYGAAAFEREKLLGDLEGRIKRLDEQARIFIPLIALCLIVAIPVWSKSATRFLMLLVNPFVLFPLGFCLIHLVLAWRGIVKAKARLRECERRTGNKDGG